jgi:hypothetical protein
MVGWLVYLVMDHCMAAPAYHCLGVLGFGYDTEFGTRDSLLDKDVAYDLDITIEIDFVCS